MKKLMMLFWLAAGFSMPVFADTTPTPSPVSSVTSQFNMAFLQHISAVDSFRQDGSHVIKFSDGIIQAIPYKNDHLLIGSFGLIPHPEDSTKFFKSYSIHAHILGFLSQYIDVNPNYASILSQLDLSPAYDYSTDVNHGQFTFEIGYVHSFGSPQ